MKKLTSYLSLVLLLAFACSVGSCVKAPEAKKAKKDLSSVVDDEELNEEMAEAVSDETTEVDGLVSEDSQATSNNTEEEVKAVNVSNNNVNAAPSSSNKSGHLVIVGNFIMEENAKTFLQTMKDNGFLDSELTVFNLSSYYTILAGRYQDKNTAESIARDFNEQFPNLEKAYVLSR